MPEDRENRGRGRAGAPRAGATDFTALGSLLGGVTRRAARDRVPPDVWQNAVGPRIARRTEPAYLNGRSLTVHVASSTWAQELSFLSNAIVRKLREAGIAVESLRFKVAEIPERDTPDDALVSRRPPVPLPEKLARRVDRIADEDLRRAIASAASHGLAYDDEEPPT